MSITQTHILNRMLRAAEAWARTRTGQPVQVRSYSEPCCGTDGAYTSQVELEVRPAAGRSEPASLRCLVTLEPDGTLGCIMHDQVIV